MKPETVHRIERAWDNIAPIVALLALVLWIGPIELLGYVVQAVAFVAFVVAPIWLVVVFLTGGR